MRRLHFKECRSYDTLYIFIINRSVIFRIPQQCVNDIILSTQDNVAFINSKILELPELAKKIKPYVKGKRPRISK